MKNRKRICPTYNTKYMTHDRTSIFEIRKVTTSKLPNRIQIIVYKSGSDEKIWLGSPLIIDTVFETTLNLYWLKRLDVMYGIFIDIPQEEKKQ